VVIIWSRIDDQRNRCFVTGSPDLLLRAGQLFAERDQLGGPAGGWSKQLPTRCSAFVWCNCMHGAHIGHSGANLCRRQVPEVVGEGVNGGSSYRHAGS
jgi:hypothetical protein